jgi:hypothetical protein
MSPLEASAKYITTTLISTIIIRLTVIAPLGIIGAAARSSTFLNGDRFVFVQCAAKPF